jgi:hypothetical protein
MAGVIKSEGRFLLQPDPALTARVQHASDIALLKKELSPPELRGLLERILQRLDALE